MLKHNFEEYLKALETNTLDAYYFNRGRLNTYLRAVESDNLNTYYKRKGK